MRPKRSADAKARKYQKTDDEVKLRITELECENAELRKSNDILKDTLVFRKRLEEVKTSKRRLCVNEFRYKYGA